MGMPDLVEPVYWTAEMVRALPDDGKRYEVVYGELLVTPAPRPRHQRIAGRIFVALSRFLEHNPVGEVLYSPADISWGPDMLVQPDVFVVPAEQAGRERWADIRSLLLVVEVLSPSTSKADRFLKRRRYQEAGVPLYWIVDAEAGQVEIWTPSDLFPVLERARLVWLPHPGRSQFELPLGGLFGK
jgi:Uma2 family endonuclease